MLFSVVEIKGRFHRLGLS